MKSVSALASKIKEKNSKFICVEYEKFDWRWIYPGSRRRKAIIDHILRNGQLCVNRKYCPQIKDDTDLQALLKKGILKQKRWGRISCRHTYLVLV